MDRGSAIGLGCGIAAIVGGNALEGGHLAALLQPTAALIVVGGTLSACLVSFPLEDFVRAVRALRSVFVRTEPANDADLVEELATYASIARREGVVALERLAPAASHPFLVRALGMASDGLDSKAMRENLEMVLDHLDERGEIPSKVWESAGGFSPTLGIIGAVMGLIHVMQNLRDVSAVGSGIAVAFVATLYGVTLANLLFIPAATKLRLRHQAEMARLTLMMEGALAIQEGRNPNLIREKFSLIVDAHRAPAEKRQGARPGRVREVTT